MSSYLNIYKTLNNFNITLSVISIGYVVIAIINIL
jgi:hypothetical protein